jgi:biotin carboxylase
VTDRRTGPLAGRRLLVLGAGHFQLAPIRCAQELGATVVAIDYVPGNPGHQIADISEVASTVELEAVLAVARRHAVDGVMTYASDVSVPAVAFVAEQLGLPGNPFAAAQALQRKDLFRALQRDIGLPHPSFASGTSPEALAAALAREGVPFPVLVKPADSSGSKGQMAASDPGGLAAAFAHARPFSRCGAVVAETLLERDLPELDGDALVQGGKLVFAHYGHNHFASPGPPWIPAGEAFPGFYGEAVIRELDRQLQLVVDRLGIRTGCLNFDGLVSHGAVHLLEVALRNGGYLVPDAIQLSTGFDIRRAAVLAAFGIDAPVPFLHAPDPGPAMTYAIQTARSGTLRGVKLDPAIAPHVVRQDLFVPVGGRVKPYTRGDYLVGMLLLRPPAGMLRRLMDDIARYVSVEVD